MLFSTTAGAGHFGPMVAIARACAAAGHEVAVAAPSSFAGAVSEAGFTHLPFPDVAPELMGAVFGRLPALPREEADRVVVTEVFGRLDAQAALPTLLTVLDEWRRNVVIRDPAELGALVAAAKFDVPQVQVAIDMGGFVPTMAGWLDEPLQTLERMAGISDVRGSERMRTTPTLTSVPEALDHPSADDNGPGSRADAARVWRYQGEIPASDASLPGEWGDPAAPLIYVSFGSVTGSLGFFDGMYPAVLAALADLPVRVLITTGHGYDPARLDPLPTNTRATRWWPQAAAMAAAALSIGHGGFGTTMTAVAAGVPQLVLPLFSADQFLNAERVEAVGVGARLLGGPDALPEVPGIVQELLDQPHYRETAERFAAEMAALPDVSTTVAVLEQLASSG